MYLGIDVGGTSFKAGLVDENYRIVDKEVCEAAKGVDNYGEYLAESMAALCRELLDRNDAWDKVSGVGAGMPGFVDPDEGVIMFTPNLPLIKAPIRDIFRAKSPLPLYIGNDANCAALGEYYAGSGSSANSMLMITLGTGVGTGLIVNGKIYTGWNGAAVEAGHLLLVMDGRMCGCGRRGCFEAYGSATALIGDAREAMRKNSSSLLWQTSGGSLDGVNGKTILAALRMGDRAAGSVWQDYLRYLAQGIINAINAFEPELICLGGGISNASDDELLIPLREAIDGATLAKGSSKQTKLTRAVLGNEAGIIGAALLGK